MNKPVYAPTEGILFPLPVMPGWGKRRDTKKKFNPEKRKSRNNMAKLSRRQNRG